jgi:hypothetical protein
VSREAHTHAHVHTPTALNLTQPLNPSHAVPSQSTGGIGYLSAWMRPYGVVY